MKIAAIFERSPADFGLANSGQARIDQAQELKAELQTFVCDGQYGQAVERILSDYLTQLDKPRQNAAWVSGFFGSGKSHLLKVMGHLWANTPFEQDGTNARNLVVGLPTGVQALLKELDTKAKQTGKPLLCAAGTLPQGTSDQVRKTVLAIILKACGLPEQAHLAKFCFWLRESGHLAAVRKAVEAAGKEWHAELRNLLVSPHIAKTLLACDSKLAADERGLRDILRAQFPADNKDLTTEEFVELAAKALANGGEIPLTILCLDEVQQYIADNAERASTITELAEVVQTRFKSRVMLVASGQSALTHTPILLKLNDRFRIKVQLTDQDVEAVTRKVLLAKKASAKPAIGDLLEKHAGEIGKHLRTSRLATLPEDLKTASLDYPLLPTRRRFWEACFKAVDAAGVHSQLRSQLRILHDALKDACDKPLGYALPGDALYEALRADLTNSGTLLKEIGDNIQKLNDGTENGRLDQRLCGLVFLIGRLPREGGADVGVRANPEMLADLLITDLGANSAGLREQVKQRLESLLERGLLMRIDQEYRLQTVEGSEWDGAFRETLGTLRGQDSDIGHRRRQQLEAAVQSALSEVRLVQGASKTPRKVRAHFDEAAPGPSQDEIILWVRDGWSATPSQVEAEAKRRGVQDATLHLYLPKVQADELKSKMLEAAAAGQVLDRKGSPSSAEGQEARRSMESRLTTAESQVADLIRRILSEAKVLKGGGADQSGNTLPEKLKAAAEDAQVRLFPRFGEADSAQWRLVMDRAREGNEDAFKAVGHAGAVEDHAVCAEVLRSIGPGAEGGTVRKELTQAPFGWPQDAIDAALVALHRANVLKATLAGQPLSAGKLEQSKISKTEFKPETVKLSLADKIAARGVYTELGLSARQSEEEITAPLAIKAMLELASKAGGDAPLPARPNTTELDALKALTGNAQVAAIAKAKDRLITLAKTWKATAKLANDREPLWINLTRMLTAAQGLPEAAAAQTEADAILAQRSLLEGADPTASLRQTLAAALRARLTQSHQAHEKAFDAAIDNLNTDARWKALAQDKRETICQQVGLHPPAAPVMDTEAQLLGALSSAGLTARADAAAVVPARLTQALVQAAQALKPAAKRVTIVTRTLESEVEVKAWLVEQEKMLLEAVKAGPVIVG